MRLHKSRGLQIMCFCTLILTTQYSVSDQVRISTFDHETTQMDVSIKVMNKLYQRLGHNMELTRFPGKRSLVEANQGRFDGELIRVKAASKLMPNLVRIPVEIGRLKGMLLTQVGKPKVVGMGGLIGKNVGILRGIELTDRITQNLPRVVMNSIDSLFQSLVGGRVDVIIFPNLDAKEYIKLHQLSEKVVINTTPIVEAPLYHFIHKSKPELIKKMTTLLKKLKKSGELDAIIYSAEQARR